MLLWWGVVAGASSGGRERGGNVLSQLAVLPLFSLPPHPDCGARALSQEPGDLRASLHLPHTCFVTLHQSLSLPESLFSYPQNMGSTKRSWLILLTLTF